MRGFVIRGTRTENRRTAAVWLGKDEYGPSWGTSLGSAVLFPDKETGLLAAHLCPGPWFNQPDLETLECLEADYTPPQSHKMILVPSSAASSINEFPDKRT
jgi:hypothetical protein